MPNPKRKGDRIEREIVELLLKQGVHARRVPLSGAIGGEFAGDIRLSLCGREMVAEVKARAGGSGFKTLERWLGDNDALFLRRDRAQPVVVLPWKTFSELLSNIPKTNPDFFEGNFPS